LNLLVSNKDASSIPTTSEEPIEESDEDDDDDDDFIDVPLESTKDNDHELLQVLGLGTAGKLNITIDLNERPTSSLFNIQMTDDNRVLIENLHDLYRQLDDVYLNKVQTWMNIFINIQQNSTNQQTTIVMKRTIDLKNSIQSCLKMIENYHLAPKKTIVTEKPGSSVSKPSVKVVTQSSSVESVGIIFLVLKIVEIALELT
jgi:hypothetical protein